MVHICQVTSISVHEMAIAKLYKALVQCNFTTDVHASLTTVPIDLPKLTATFLRHTFFINNYASSLQNFVV